MAGNTVKKFLDDGSPVRTIQMIYKNNQRGIKILNPEKLILHDSILPGTLGRIHSRQNNPYEFKVWLLDERGYSTIIVEVPGLLMAQFFEQHPHNIFPRFA